MRQLNNEELNSAGDQRRMRWTRYVAHMMERRVVYRVLVGKYEGQRPLETPRRRWEDNIKMDLQKWDVG
jgi:hypothetical protein